MRRLAASTLAIVSLTLALATAAPANAATGDLEVSPDGSSYSKAYPGILFDSIGTIVPGDEIAESFMLRNSGDAPGFLRIVMSDVTFDDLDFANALTVQTTVASAQGARTTISLAQPCWVLLEGTVVQPGAVVRVDTNLALGNLDGVVGQGATAAFALSASLSDTTPGSLSPTDCGGSDVSVPVVGTPRSNVPANPADPAPAASAVPEAEQNSDGELPVLNLPGGIVIDPNTWQLWEEYLVLILVAAALAGGFWYLVFTRRRRQDEDVPVAPQSLEDAP